MYVYIFLSGIRVNDNAIYTVISVVIVNNITPKANTIVVMAIN